MLKHALPFRIVRTLPFTDSNIVSRVLRTSQTATGRRHMIHPLRCLATISCPILENDLPMQHSQAGTYLSKVCLFSPDTIEKTDTYA